MLARALRALGWLAFGGLVVGVFGFAAYFSFSLFVRSGVTTVPALEGLPEDQALGRLADTGLKVRRRPAADRYDAEMAAGHVLQQTPGAGSLVKQDSEVEIVMSLGPELLEVPDLVGKALQTAQVTLSAAGLAVGRTAGVYRAGAQPGTVVDQVPPPGARVGRSAAVALYLCLDSPTDTFVMPDLAYRDFRLVRHFFDRRGFRLGSVKFEPYEGIAPGIVLRQYPLPGHPLHRRDVISLVVTAEERVGA